MGISQVGGREGNDAFDARLDPDHAGLAHVLLVVDAYQQRGESVEWMCDIDHVDRADGQEREAAGVILLVGFCLTHISSRTKHSLVRQYSGDPDCR